MSEIDKLRIRLIDIAQIAEKLIDDEIDSKTDRLVLFDKLQQIYTLTRAY